MGTSLGDKVVIVIALLLLAVVAVVSAEFPGIIRAARTRRGPVGFAVVIDWTLNPSLLGGETWEGGGVKNPRRLAALAALCGTVALAGWVGGLAGLGSPGIESTGAPIEVSRVTSATARAEHVDTPQATALGEDGVSVADMGSGSAALSDPRPMPRPAAVPVLFAAVSPTDPVQNAARPAVNSEALDACHEPDVCIDQYLWSLYQRTPKVDTIKVEERIRVKVRTRTRARRGPSSKL